MRIDTLLREEIELEFEGLRKMELGTEQYRTTVDGLSKLLDRAIGMDQSDAELQEKIDSRISDTELKLQAAKDDKVNRIVSHCINVAGIVLPIAVTIWGTRVSLRFEETGTVTTLMGRGFINKLLPKMR